MTPGRLPEIAEQHPPELDITDLAKAIARKARAALLDKATPDAVFAFSADELSALLAYVRELESYCAGYKKMIDAVTDPAVCEAAADALERLARERDDIRKMLQDYDAWTQEQTSGKGVIGSLPGHTEGQKMPGPLDHQSAAGTNCAAECAVRAPESFARGPAADPIADLCAWLRAKYARHGEIEDRDAADALERLAATERLLQACIRHETARAERAEAERDTLRKCLKSVVSAWDDDDKPTWYERWQSAIDAARAKVNTTEGEK